MCNVIYPAGSVISQGRPQNLAGRGGGKNFFFRFGNLHVAKRHATHVEVMRLRMSKSRALLGEFGDMFPRENFLNGANWCVLVYIWIRFCLYNF